MRWLLPIQRTPSYHVRITRRYHFMVSSHSQSFFFWRSFLSQTRTSFAYLPRRSRNVSTQLRLLRKLWLKFVRSPPGSSAFGKKRCRDFPSKKLIFSGLQSRYAAHTADQRFSNRNEVVEAKRKHLKSIGGELLHFAHWRTSHATSVCR